MNLPTDKQWREKAKGVLYIHGDSCLAIRVDTAWAFIRFFRTGVMFTTPEEMRQWAEEEYAAFLERSAMVPSKPKPKRPRIVPVK